MLMEIKPSWLHTVAQENQQRLEGNSLGQIGYLNIGSVIRGLQGSWFALAGSSESWRVSSPWSLDYNCGVMGQPWASLQCLCSTPWHLHSHPSANLGDLSDPTQRKGAPLTPSTPISMLKSICLIPGLSFPSLLLFFLISSHLPKKGSAAASLRAYSQSMDARNAFNWLEFARSCLVQEPRDSHWGKGHTKK